MRKYCVNYSNKFPMITSKHDMCESRGEGGECAVNFRIWLEDFMEFIARLDID